MKSIKHLILLIIIATSLTTQAQTMADIWITIPNNIIPITSTNARLDLTDLYQANLAAQSATPQGESIQLITLQDKYIHLRTNNVTTIQVKQLKQGRKTIYAVITTIEGPAPNSHLDIYNDRWEKLNTTRYFTPPTVAHFIADKEQQAHHLRDITIHTIQYTMSNDNNDIVATPSFLNTLDKETRLKVEPHCHPAITLQWSGRKWQKP